MEYTLLTRGGESGTGTHYNSVSTLGPREDTMTFVEELPPEQIQIAMDEALRFALEVVTFEKIILAHGERPPDLSTEVADALQEAIRTLNNAVKLGYRPATTSTRTLKPTCGTTLGERRGWNGCVLRSYTSAEARR